MYFRLLGPLEVTGDDGRPVQIVRGRESGLLALLLLHANEPLPPEWIVEELWGGSAPENARKSVHIYVSHLRKKLGSERIKTTPAGYLLSVATDELDVSRFESLASRGRQALDGGSPEEAERVLDRALTLWAAPLADFRFDAFVQGEVRRLDELHDRVVADRAEARIGCGRAHLVLGELAALVERAPLSERPCGQLMRALYLTGQQADALELYRRTRAVLNEELGVEPGPELQRLERQILNQEPALGEPAPLPRPLIRRRRFHVAAAAAIALAAAAVFAAVALSRADSAPAVRIVHNSIAVVDPRTDRLVTDIPVDDGPGRLITGGGNVWSLNTDSRTVSRVDATRINGVRTFAIGSSPGDIAYGDGALWTDETTRDRLERIDPETGMTVRAVMPTTPVFPQTQDGGEVGYAANAVWFGSDHATITRVDPKTLRVLAIIREVDVGPGGEIVGGPDAVWFDDSFGNITRVDPRTNDVVGEAHLSTSNVGGIAVSSDAVWATAVDQGLVWEIDPQKMQAIDSYPVGADPLGVAVGAGSVWIANAGGTLTRLDPSSGKTTTIRLGGSPVGVAFADKLIWIGID